MRLGSEAMGQRVYGWSASSDSLPDPTVTSRQPKAPGVFHSVAFQSRSGAFPSKAAMCALPEAKAALTSSQKRVHGSLAD